MQRWVIILTIALCELVGLVLVGERWFRPPPPGPGVTFENLQRVNSDTTAADLKSLFGPPSEPPAVSQIVDTRTWKGKGIEVQVTLTHGGAVMVHYRTPDMGEEWDGVLATRVRTDLKDKSFRGRLRRWLGF